MRCCSLTRWERGLWDECDWPTVGSSRPGQADRSSGCRARPSQNLNQTSGQASRLSQPTQIFASPSVPMRPTARLVGPNQ
ncbi:unnamed protein product [Protopolystoma xenopodis]|uniref:Uncharacterized protein n=1 Tax=Protopolystoma xenopodis TaxID=117903 RepID=A0A3S4ZUC9_9PLAT|nr:unnamed protein product [Protopolystoma xenopodis]